MTIIKTLAAAGLALTTLAAVPATAQEYRDYRGGYDYRYDRDRDHRDGRYDNGYRDDRYDRGRHYGWYRGNHYGWRHHDRRCWVEYRRGYPIRHCY